MSLAIVRRERIQIWVGRVSSYVKAAKFEFYSFLELKSEWWLSDYASEGPLHLPEWGKRPYTGIWSNPIRSLALMIGGRTEANEWRLHHELPLNIHIYIDIYIDIIQLINILMLWLGHSLSTQLEYILWYYFHETPWQWNETFHCESTLFFFVFWRRRQDCWIL